MFHDFTDDQVARFTKAGEDRYANCRNKGIYDRTVPISRTQELDILGAAAELAVAEVTGLPWHAELYSAAEYQDRSKRPGGGHDVGHLEVRSTDYSTGCLLIQANDGVDDIFVFVTVDLPNRRARLVGWLTGGEGKKQEWWRLGNYGAPCYYVPQSKLRPMAELLTQLGRSGPDATKDVA